MSKKGKKQKEPAMPKTLVSPDISIARAIERLATDESILLLGKLRQNEPPRFALMHNIAIDYGLAWLEDYTIDELCLNVSVGESGRKSVVDVARQPQMVMGGITDRIKTWLKGDRY